MSASHTDTTTTRDKEVEEQEQGGGAGGLVRGVADRIVDVGTKTTRSEPETSSACLEKNYQQNLWFSF